MDVSLSFYVAALAAVLITGVSKSGFGGGMGVMAVPIMSVFVAPQVAAAVMMPILLAMDLLIVHRYRKTWSRRIVFALLPAAGVGLAIGALLFEAMSAEVIRAVIGLLALIFVLQYVFQARGGMRAWAAPTWVTWGLAAVSGFASYVAHAGGPPVKGYLLRQGLEKSVFVGTNTVYFFVLNGIKTLAYGSTGTLSLQTLLVSLWLVPALVMGVWLGGRLHHLVAQTLFVKIVYGFLALTAIRLLSESVPLLWRASP